MTDLNIEEDCDIYDDIENNCFVSDKNEEKEDSSFSIDKISTLENQIQKQNQDISNLKECNLILQKNLKLLFLTAKREISNKNRQIVFLNRRLRECNVLNEPKVTEEVPTFLSRDHQISTTACTTPNTDTSDKDTLISYYRSSKKNKKANTNLPVDLKNTNTESHSPKRPSNNNNVLLKYQDLNSQTSSTTDINHTASICDNNPIICLAPSVSHKTFSDSHSGKVESSCCPTKSLNSLSYSSHYTKQENMQDLPCGNSVSLNDTTCSTTNALPSQSVFSISTSSSFNNTEPLNSLLSLISKTSTGLNSKELPIVSDSSHTDLFNLNEFPQVNCSKDEQNAISAESFVPYNSTDCPDLGKIGSVPSLKNSTDNYSEHLHIDLDEPVSETTNEEVSSFKNDDLSGKNKIRVIQCSKPELTISPKKQLKYKITKKIIKRNQPNQNKCKSKITKTVLPSSSPLLNLSNECLNKKPLKSDSLLNSYHWKKKLLATTPSSSSTPDKESNFIEDSVMIQSKGSNSVLATIANSKENLNPSPISLSKSHSDIDSSGFLNCEMNIKENLKLKQNIIFSNENLNSNILSTGKNYLKVGKTENQINNSHKTLIAQKSPKLDFTQQPTVSKSFVNIPFPSETSNAFKTNFNTQSLTTNDSNSNNSNTNKSRYESYIDVLQRSHKFVCSSKNTEPISVMKSIWKLIPVDNTTSKNSFLRHDMSLGILNDVSIPIIPTEKTRGDSNLPPKSIPTVKTLLTQPLITNFNMASQNVFDPRLL